MSDAAKAQLTEAEIRTRYITPALSSAGCCLLVVRKYLRGMALNPGLAKGQVFRAFAEGGVRRQEQEARRIWSIPRRQ